MARIRGNKWQGDASYQGRRVRRSFDTRVEAAAWEGAVRLADATGKPLPSEATGMGPQRGYKLAYGQFVREHFNYIWSDVTSKRHIMGNLRLIGGIIGEDTPIDQITFSTIVEIAESLKAQGNSNSTINRKFAALSKLLKHAHKLKLISSIPELPRYREREGRIRFFTKEEEEKIIRRMRHFGLHESAHLTNFLLYTGARRSEAHRVEKRDIDWSTNKVTFWDTKADKPRSNPITPPVKEAIKAFMDLYPDTPKLVGIPYDTYRTHWEMIRADLGYIDDPEFVPHTLRHTCASRLVQRGVDLRRVQMFMGHKAIATTLRYAHLAPDDLDVAAEALMK